MIGPGGFDYGAWLDRECRALEAGKGRERHHFACFQLGTAFTDGQIDAAFLRHATWRLSDATMRHLAERHRIATEALERCR